MQSERIWDDIVKKLQQKEYTFDAGTYGRVGEFVKKIAYFYHASIQGAGAYPGAAMRSAWWPNGASPRGFWPTGSASRRGSCSAACASKIRGSIWLRRFPRLCGFCRPIRRAKKPSETLFIAPLRRQRGAKGVSPDEVLHVGSNLGRDIAPRKRLGSAPLSSRAIATASLRRRSN